MKRILMTLVLMTLAVAVFAQSDWDAAYNQAIDLQQKARVVQRMDRMNAQGDIWITVLLDLYLQWNNLGNTLDKIAVEESLRTVLKNAREQELEDGGAIIYAIARQSMNPHLKAEAILGMGHMQFDRALPWLTNYLWHLSQGPGVDPLGDEIIGSACVESLRLYKATAAEAALTAASDPRAWFPDYIRNSAQEGLDELARIIDL